MFLAGVRHDLGTVALGNHHKRCAVVLEFIHIGVHPVGRRGTHRAAGISFGRLGGTGIQDRMVLEIGGHFFTGIQAGLELGVGDVAGHDDGAFEVDTGAYTVSGECRAYGVDAFVEVDFNAFGTFAGTTEFFRNQFRRVGVHLLDPHAVGVDLGFDVAIGAATHAHTDRAAGPVTGKAHHTDVVGQVLAAELGAETNLLRFLEQFFLQVDVAEGTAGLISGSGKVVVKLDAGQLYREQVLLG